MGFVSTWKRRLKKLVPSYRANTQNSNSVCSHSHRALTEGRQNGLELCEENQDLVSLGTEFGGKPSGFLC